MSLKTRLGLLAGSSLTAAGLAAAASFGVGLAPTPAFAQACTPATAPGVNGAAPDSYTCTGGAGAAGTYAAGITYSSVGALTVTTALVPPSINGLVTVTANGVNLTGNGSDSVTWNSAAGGLTGGVGTAGPVLDVVTATGDISITTAGVTGTQAGTTYGIRAVSGDPLTSTPGGDIMITRSLGGVNNNVAGGEAAIAAITNGGDISITANTTGFTQGRARGILAQTNGAGTIAIAVGGNVNASTIDGVAAIDTIAGTGATVITLNAGTMNGGAGIAIRSVTGGAVTIQSSTTTFGGVNGRIDFSGVAGGATWNGAARATWDSSGVSVFTAVADTINLGGGSLATGGSISFGGGNDTFGGSFTVGGLFDFGVGADVLNATGTFAVSSGGTVDLGAGADTVNATGTLSVIDGAFNLGADNDVLNASGVLDTSNATLDFGAGTDDLNQNDVFFAGAVTTLSNLETFDNSGVIYLGGFRDFRGDDYSDGTANDRIVMSSGVFTGSGDSRMVLNADLGTGASQLGCTTLVSADCVDFTGATTAGSTLLTIQDISFSIDGGTLNSVITLIQGATAAEHFSLDPASTYYGQTPQGPAIRKPVVAYYFTYDEANHRHVLVGAPTDEVFQVGTFATSAQETWRATTGSWLNRQADLRATPGGLESSAGVWARVGGQAGERELATSYSVAGLSFDYDLSQKQRIAHMVFGADFLGAAGADSAFVLGGMVGFVRSDVEFEATPTEAVLSGFSGGLYASYVAGPLFIDATANANILHIKADAPTMGLGLDVPMKFDLKSLGGQVEAGWRIETGSGLFVEPLAGVSYVVTKFEDTEVPGGSGLLGFEETKSLRLGGGARVGLDGELMGMTASYSLTGRYWNDSEGGSSLDVVTASGSSVSFDDDFGGGFSEVSGSLNLFSDDGGLSGFVNLGGKFADGYQSVDGSVGVRVRW